ncbi:MAG: DUF2189 domain-containing protein [Rhodobacteraceae bacterium]|nr:DUF2189 domain-containing protein [Paracoccaceae bacterium]
MTETIGNPLSWGAQFFGRAGEAAQAAHDGLAGAAAEPPAIRAIGTADIRAALRDGMADFMALRTDVIAMCLLYPLIGALIVYAALNQNFVHLVYPLLSGFALVGPAAAVGLYEMSKRREAGLETGWADGFRVLRSPSIAGIAVLAAMLAGTFAIWILVALGVHALTMGPDLPVSARAFLTEVLTTGHGWAMIVLGTGVGFVFAAAVLVASAFSFPLMVDRPVGLPVAVVTSARVARQSPGTVALWGLIVAALLVLGSIPLLLGLAVVLPVLGHATWHLYRRAVV